MIYWQHRMSGVGVHYDRHYENDAILHLPEGSKPPEQRPSGRWEIRLPAGALASFGWDAGVAEVEQVVRSFRHTVRDNKDKVYNSAIEDVLSELDRMRRIGR